MLTFHILFCILSTLAISIAAPVSVQREAVRSVINKLTCKHKSEASNRSWKQCSNSGDDVLDIAQMQIPHTVSLNQIPALNIPINTFRCFRTSTYSPSNSGSECPAFCRLRDLKESAECKTGDALNMNHLEEHGIAIVKSPRYDCSKNYFRNEICVYNISMGCAEKSHVDISSTGSEVDLGDGDIINIFNYKNNHQQFQPITGQGLTHTQLTIPETDFLMVFTSNRDSDQGKGFKLQLECPLLKETPSTTEDGEDIVLSSGDDDE